MYGTMLEAHVHKPRNHCRVSATKCIKFSDNTVPKEINFPQYNMKCSGKNVILRGIFHVVHIMFSMFSCYIAEIGIIFRTVKLRNYSRPELVQTFMSVSGPCKELVKFV